MCKTLEVHCMDCGKLTHVVPSEGGATGISHGGLCDECLGKRLAGLAELNYKNPAVY